MSLWFCVIQCKSRNVFFFSVMFIRKETKTDSWVSIASVPASCDYTLHSRGGAVVLSSPLPACHTEKLVSFQSLHTSIFVEFKIIFANFIAICLKCSEKDLEN